MSDGPLFSPHMCKPTRRLAEACSNSATSSRERAEIMEDIALHTFKKEGGEKTLKIIQEILASLDGDLFSDNRADTLEAARINASQDAFSQSLFDNVVEVTHDGLNTAQAIEVGLGNTLACRIASEARAIVEHGLNSNDVSVDRAMRAGVLINEASTHLNTRNMAKEIIENGIRSRSIQSTKRKSLDEGPSL